MQKHKEYQFLRALSDGWKIEYNTSEGWKHISYIPPNHNGLRIVPDEDDFLPFYAHKESECPVDEILLVECEYPDGEVIVGGAGKFDWTDRDSITRYRLVKSQRPDCFNKGIEGGSECYFPECIYHAKDEPICDGDPYSELKAAHEAGKTIQQLFSDDGSEQIWSDKFEGWHLPVDKYRIKPKTKKKMWQWIGRTKMGEVFLTEFHASKEEAQSAHNCDLVEIIQRADWTEIDIEVYVNQEKSDG